MDLRRFIEEKWVRNGKTCHFWVKLANWYRYQKLVYRYPFTSRGLVPVPVKLVPVPVKLVSVPELPATLFCIPCTVKSRIRTPIVRDPNKGLIGVHIRVYERENVPYLATSTKRYSFSTINCSTTKSGEFVFD